MYYLRKLKKYLVKARFIEAWMFFHKTFIQLCSTGITPDFATTMAKNYDPIGNSFHTWILTKTYIFVYMPSLKKIKEGNINGVSNHFWKTNS